MLQDAVQFQNKFILQRAYCFLRGCQPIHNSGVFFLFEICRKSKEQITVI